MRILATVQACSAAAALMLVTGCSGGSAIAPKPSNPQSQAPSTFSRGSLGPVEMLALSAHSKIGYRGASFNTCPATGLIEYVSVPGDATINIFAGDFHGQAPCGIITGLMFPLGMVVKSGTLFAVDMRSDQTAGVVKAFHRGASTPFMTYSAPCSWPVDDAVSDDGYVFAMNLDSGCGGSLSVWKKSTGAFIANYPAPVNGDAAGMLTIQKDGTVYVVENGEYLWSAKCVKGVCGSFTNTGATLGGFGGIRSVRDEHIVVLNGQGFGGGIALTYIPPSFSAPAGNCTLGLVNPTMIDLNFRQNHIYVSDEFSGIASEFRYPSGGGNGSPCPLVGTVDTSSAYMFGIAVDRPTSL
jgi:hypothetical protein